MKIKNNERIEARKLRSDGKSIKSIARMIGVSSGSVSVWVRDILISEEQRNILDSSNGSNWKTASVAYQKKTKERRDAWYIDGIEMYKKEGKDFAVGCSLYWAEGTKHRNSLQFCNTDEKMMKFFIFFLRKFFNISDDEIGVVVNCYLNNGLTIEQIQDYWLKVLNLPISCLRKATIKSVYYNGKSSGKHPYGVCRISIGRTDIIQKMFGAISAAIEV